MSSAEQIKLLSENIQKVIIGKNEVITKVIAALLAGGHVLIEDVPGVGKTRLVTALAKSVNGKYNRIQLTPDVMPSDIVGFTMIHPETKKMSYRQGAAVCNFLLADEINRASPKAQSSLLEAMEEQQISIEGQTMKLPRPFMTLATQNPVETYGTYHLPEAQMDRFLLRISIGYPSREEELQIIDTMNGENPAATLPAVLGIEDIIALQEETRNVSVHSVIKEYIWQIANATRTNDNIRLGVSPRGSIALLKVSKAYALIMGRNYVVPDDVQEMLSSALAHRLILSPKGKSSFKSQEALIAKLMEGIPAPIPQNQAVSQ